MMVGRARDCITSAEGGAAIVLADDWLRICATPRREILEIETCRGSNAAQALVSIRGGGHLRQAIGRLLPEERAALSPLHLLLDDFSGASLVANWGWSQWLPDWRERMYASGANNAGKNGKMEGVCAGFRPGSSALTPSGIRPSLNAVPVTPLINEDDPDGWHLIEAQQGPGMRRARRLDVWLQGDVARIDASFQDSATRPEGGRAAVHEYRLAATADLAEFRLRSIDIVPCVLPYSECLGAVPSPQQMLGLPLSDFRLEVLARLQGTVGCTHLNDVLRSLSDVPTLVRHLRANLAGAAADANVSVQ